MNDETYLECSWQIADRLVQASDLDTPDPLALLRSEAMDGE